MEKVILKERISTDSFKEILLEAFKASEILYGGSTEKKEEMVKLFLKRNSYWAANAVGGFDSAEMKKFIESIKVMDSTRHNMCPLNGSYYDYDIFFEDVIVNVSVRDIFYDNIKGYRTTDKIVCRIEEVIKR